MVNMNTGGQAECRKWESSRNCWQRRQQKQSWMTGTRKEIAE